jgi:hypothetical protein
MSSASPSRGLLAKTSDLTDFFRGGGHTSLQARHSNNDISTTTRSSMALEVPSSCDEGAVAAVPTKKKITRIPLFGRSRKKSNQSATSSPFASSGGGRYSSEGGELEMSSASRGPSTDRCVLTFFADTFLFGIGRPVCGSFLFIVLHSLSVQTRDTLSIS